MPQRGEGDEQFLRRKKSANQTIRAAKDDAMYVWHLQNNLGQHF
jgi:hypothetical protein